MSDVRFALKRVPQARIVANTGQPRWVYITEDDEEYHLAQIVDVRQTDLTVQLHSSGEDEDDLIDVEYEQVYKRVILDPNRLESGWWESTSDWKEMVRLVHRYALMPEYALRRIMTSAPIDRIIPRTTNPDRDTVGESLCPQDDMPIRMLANQIEYAIWTWQQPQVSALHIRDCTLNVTMSHIAGGIRSAVFNPFSAGLIMPGAARF